MLQQHILVVEDEDEIAAYLRRGLTMDGYIVEVANDGTSALAAAQRTPPDLIILDLLMPGLDGIQVAKQLRSTNANMPIIMLTARDSVADRVAGLESGADDYLTKPFAYDELLARIRVQLRHRRAREIGEVLQYNALRLDVAGHAITVNERRVELTAKEFEVLELFMRNPQQVLTRDLIYDRVWAYNFGAESNVIEVYIRALRQKLEAAGAPRLLQTIRGIGYVLREEHVELQR